jgi:hypothetical protein
METPWPMPIYRHQPTMSRRSLLKLAGSAPLLGLAIIPARATERVSFADISINEDAFTPKAKTLAGTPVEMRGYMAPPLKPEVDFFVLTSLPTAVCPFCDSVASWPDDIVLIFLNRPVRALAYDRLISVTGTLEIGTDTDDATGFVSRVRLRDSKYVKV